MADTTILVPGNPGGECNPSISIEDTSKYLIKDNYLGEFEENFEKEIARENLGVYGKTDVYTQDETLLVIKESNKELLDNHLDADDPHGIIPQIEPRFNGLVRDDGTTPFTQPQTGVDPISDFHLTTKRFVSSLLTGHLGKTDPHNIMPLVQEALKEYIKATQVYNKKEVYTRKEVEGLIGGFVKKDGTTPFIKPQLGVTPLSDNHLSTKKYADDLMRSHMVDIDPHGFGSILSQKMSNYYKKSETYSKAETYSRAQISLIINELVRDAALSAIEEHINQYDPHGVLREIDSRNYVKRDGSVPFTSPQKGIDATEDDELITLRQLKELIGDPEDPDNPGQIGGCEGWKTSGPVQTTVGFVEDNTLLPEKLSCQEVLDLIFYGKGIDVKSPAYCAHGQTVPVTMIIHGSTALIQYGELWQDGVQIGIYSKEDFAGGEYTVDSLPITKDTPFTFKVMYENGTELQAQCMTKVAYLAFIGLLPKWYNGSNVTYDYLLDLIVDDPLNNTIDTSGDSISEIKQKYSFSSPGELKHPFVALPKDYPNLVQLITPSQNFGLEAFDIISDIPMRIPGVAGDKIYKIYIYREALVALNVEVTFKFN